MAHELTRERYVSQNLTDPLPYVFVYGSGNTFKFNHAAQKLLGFPERVRVFMDPYTERIFFEGSDTEGTRLRDERYDLGMRWRFFVFRLLAHDLGIANGQRMKFLISPDGSIDPKAGIPFGQDRKMERLDND